MSKLTAFTIAALLLASPWQSRADEIGLKTNKAVGETLELALNADVPATITWSDGTTESVTFDGTPLTLTIKADSLVITTTDASITRFYAPSAGLVSLNTDAAPSLLKLLCPDNALTTLGLTKNKSLTELDCQGNALTLLNLSNCTKLEHINCANNALTAINYTTTAYMQSLVCEDNAIDTLKRQTSFVKMKTLWCGQNKLRTLNLSRATALKSIAAQDNAITSFTVGEMPSLTDLWIGRSTLDTLDLSSGTPSLVSLDADDCNLATIYWDSSCKSTLRYVNIGNNRLFFNSFPTIKDEMTAVLTPQEAYQLTGNIIVNEQQDWSDVLFRNAFNLTLGLTPVVTTADGQTLEKGKDKDYTYSVGKWTFYTMNKGVTITATSKQYPDITLSIKPFDVTDATGIQAATLASDLSISTTGGQLNVTAPATTIINVYDAAGRCVIGETISAGHHSWPLATGIYVVNGKKVVVTR